MGLAISPDGQTVVAAVNNKIPEGNVPSGWPITVTKVARTSNWSPAPEEAAWDVVDRIEREGWDYYVSLSFHPGGRMIAVGSQKQVFFYNDQLQPFRHVLAPHHVKAVTFSGNGDRIAAASLKGNMIHV